MKLIGEAIPFSARIAIEERRGVRHLRRYHWPRLVLVELLLTGFSRKISGRVGTGRGGMFSTAAPVE